MISIIVAGALGKMGKNIIECAQDNKDVKVIGGLELSDTARNISSYEGVPITADEQCIKNADAVIDFTAPHAALLTLSYAEKYGKPIVIGTTGFSKEDIEQIKKTSHKIPVVLSPNMSTGINLLYQLAAAAAQVLKGYDMEIVETHHNKKQDAPSGTAQALAQVIADSAGIKDMCYGRKGAHALRRTQEIGIHAVRAGDIIGDHTIMFAGKGERIEITHRAHSRATFAYGALHAVIWVYNKKPGLYSMKEVLERKGTHLFEECPQKYDKKDY